MALSAIGIALVVLIIILAVIITRSSPRAYDFFSQVKQTIFWNFLIRYFQASFIGFNFTALVIVIKPNVGFKDIATSIGILVLQFGVVFYASCLLLKRQLLKLGTH